MKNEERRDIEQKESNNIVRRHQLLIAVRKIYIIRRQDVSGIHQKIETLNQNKKAAPAK